MCVPVCVCVCLYVCLSVCVPVCVCTSGLLWVLPITSPSYGTIFCVTLRSMPGKLFNGVMGEVVSGLAILRAAVLHRPIEDITVKDCGIIFTG